MNFYESNIAALRKYYPGLAEKIFNHEPHEPHERNEEFLTKAQRGEDLTLRNAAYSAVNNNIEVMLAASGDATLVVDGKHIHSNRDPRREGEALAKSAAAENAEAFVVLGFGLGYAAEALAAIAPEKPVIIVEKNDDIFRAALESRDLSKLFSSGKIIFQIGGDAGGVLAALGVLEEAGIKSLPSIIKNRALVSLDEEWYGAAESRIATWASKAKINAATARRFGRRWTKNLAANLSAIRDVPGVALLQGIAASPPLPVFLAAAGPSLDESGPHLAAIRERCIVVACDTALRFLLANGADPDFAVAVDPQFWNGRHLHHSGKTRARFVVESAAYPAMLRPPWDIRAGGFLCQSLFPLGRFVEDRVDPKGALGAGGSVATTAWDFARLLKPQQIWIAGLDLGFPGRRTHFSGALFEETAHAASCRFRPAETASVLALESGIPFYAPSAAGGRVLTDKRLAIYAAWFENRLAQEKGIASFSLSREGLRIAGLHQSTIEELLALPPRRKEIDALLAEVFSRIQVEFDAPEAKAARGKRYGDAAAALVSGLEGIRGAAERGLEILAQSTQRHKEEEVVLRRLDDVNRAIAQSPVKDAAGLLFPPAEELEAKIAETDPLRRHLAFSRLLYGELAEAADFTLKTLKKAGKTPIL